jgi:hypothetical protein
MTSGKLGFDCRTYVPTRLVFTRTRSAQAAFFFVIYQGGKAQFVGEGTFFMFKSVLFLGILISGLQSFGLAKAVSCKQVKMNPEELYVDVSLAPQGAAQTITVSKYTNVPLSKKEFVATPAVTADPKIKAQWNTAEINLQVSNTEGRSSDGDYGFLSKFSGQGYVAEEMICWFFKHSK